MFLNWRGYLICLALVALVTVFKIFAQPLLVPTGLSYPYMLVIVPVAIYFGLGPALLASILSTLAQHFFFNPPLYTFGLPTAEESWALTTFFLVSIVLSLLASGMRRKTEEVKRLSLENIQSQENERKRLARELHDDTAPNLAYLSLELDSIVDKSPDLSEGNVKRLKEIREKLNRTQQDIRRFSHELHPAILDNLGLEPALEALIADLNSRMNMRITFEVAGTEAQMPDEVRLELYRIAQEALNNIRKHSGTTEAAVCLKYSPDKTRLSVVDYGSGFNPSTLNTGLGLTSMRERANLIGAKLEVHSRTGRGTTVSVELKI